MANHGYVKTEKTISLDELRVVVKMVIEKYNLNGLEYLETQEWNGLNFWLILNDYDSVNFWLSDNKEFGSGEGKDYVEYDEPKILSTKSVIEFRHGHGNPFMWWLEKPFMYEFAKAFDGKIFDDCCSEEMPIKESELDPIKYLETKMGKHATIASRTYHLDHLKMMPQKLIDDLKLKKFINDFS